MTEINQLTALDTLAAGDQLPVWATANGDTRRASLTTLTGYLNDALTFPSALTFTQLHAAPSATGFSVSISAGWTWLVLTPVAGYAAGTIVLPAAPADNDEILVNSTQAVTTLTVNGNGNTVTGAPTTLAANGFFRLKFDATLDAWYRVG